MFKICCLCVKPIITCCSKYSALRENGELKYLHYQCYKQLYNSKK